MKRAVGFVVLLAAGLAAVLLINRDQSQHALISDFERKVLAVFECSDADRAYLAGQVAGAHERVGAAFTTADGSGVRDHAGYIVAMLAELARQARTDGKPTLADALQAESKRYLKP